MSTIIGAWLIFSVSTLSNASQTVTAIPFVNIEFCERQMDRVVATLVQGTQGNPRQPITIMPFCTTQAPGFWVPPKEMR